MSQLLSSTPNCEGRSDPEANNPNALDSGALESRDRACEKCFVQSALSEELREDGLRPEAREGLPPKLA